MFKRKVILFFRSSNYVPYMTRKKGPTSRVFRTVRPHTDTTQQAATSQRTPHEVYVPIHGKTIIRPEYRYVYIPSKSSHSVDFDHIYNVSLLTLHIIRSSKKLLIKQPNLLFHEPLSEMKEISQLKFVFFLNSSFKSIYYKLRN